MNAAVTVACYHAGNGMVAVVRLLVARWRVAGHEHVPRSGPFVLASNHVSLTDPPLIACALGRRRRIRYMAKSEIFRPPWGIVPRLYGAFPVRRLGADAAALLKAERILREGYAVGMFPEGTRGRGDGIRAMHHGAAFVALRTGSPILPCAITGTDSFARPSSFLRRPRITVTFGERIAVEANESPPREELEALTARVQAAIAYLYEGVVEAPAPVASVSDFTP